MRSIYYIIIPSIFIISCKTEEKVLQIENPPTVITNDASDISFKYATLKGEVSHEGFSAANDRGFVFSEKNSNPSVSDSKIQSGYGKGIYSIKVDILIENTKYYFKAYATNSKGTGYGEVKSFITSDYNLASVKTDIPLNITNTTAEIGGSILDGGGLAISQRGICFGLNPNPTILDNIMNAGNGLGLFSVIIKNLKENSKYFVRAYAVNSKGTSYGNEQIFTTLAPAQALIPREENTKVIEVKSKTGRIWMDRNLGAIQVATSSTDQLSYGDLYQWGRSTDGHQKRNSNITIKLSSSDLPGHGDFIIATHAINQSNTQDWRSPGNDNLWQGVNGINNVCPVGFRLPTEQEWKEEFSTWNTPANSEAAFNSPLKLPVAGFRYYDTGNFYPDKIGGLYWSSSNMYGLQKIFGARSIEFFRPLRDQNGVILPHSDGASIISSPNRAEGLSVRCIKN